MVITLPLKQHISWFEATLLLPRPASIAATAEGMNNDEIAGKFDFSKS